MYICIGICQLSTIAGQTAGPNGLTFEFLFQNTKKISSKLDFFKIPGTRPSISASI